MWRRTRQRRMGKGVCPCGDYIRKGEREREEKRKREISHSALPIVGVRADVKHVHHFEGIGKVIIRVPVRSVEWPDRKRSGILCTVTPIDREDDVESFCPAFAITKAFFEDPCERRVIRVHTTPSIRKGRVRIIVVIKRRGRWCTVPIGQFVVSYH